MPVNFGSLSVANAFVGDKAVSAMYLGDTQVYPNWDEGTGDVRVRVQTPDDATDLTLTFFRFVSTESDGFVVVDWGDGKRDRYTGAAEIKLTHTYTNAGEYIVKMTGSKFTEIRGVYYGGSYNVQPWLREILSLKMPEDSSGVNLNFSFCDCYNLTGSIPEWDEKITGAMGTYGWCSGLTGSIPAWGANITDAEGTYWNCTGLESCSDALLENPMPSTIKHYTNCVTGCVDAIRQHFTEDWGGTKTA